MKRLFSFLFISILCCFPFSVYAIESYDELDPNKNIEFPARMYPDQENKLTIKNVENYKLYYQYQEISDEDLAQINANLQQIKDLNTDVDAIKEKQDVCQTYSDDYEESQDPEDLEKLETCSDELNTMVEEYENAFEILTDALVKLFPDYVEEDWTETTDDTIAYQTVNPGEEKSYMLWVKLENTDDSSVVYDTELYTFNGIKVNQEFPEEINPVATPMSSSSEEQEENPNTADTNVILLSILGIGVVGIFVVCGKKLKAI